MSNAWDSFHPYTKRGFRLIAPAPSWYGPRMAAARLGSGAAARPPVRVTDRELGLRRKRGRPEVLEMAATETMTSISLSRPNRVSRGTATGGWRFQILGRERQSPPQQMLSGGGGIRDRRAKTRCRGKIPCPP